MNARDRLRIQTLTARISQRLHAMGGPHQGPPGSETVNSAFGVIQDYERLAREIYRIRAQTPARETDPLIARTEDFLASLAQDLVQMSRSKGQRNGYAAFADAYRRIWRENMSLFVFTASIFVGSLLLGWNIGRFQHDYVPLIVGQNMMEVILDHRPWFESLNDNPLMGALQIGINNIKVTLLIFALGSLCGIGGLGLLIYNGITIGALMGYCAAFGFEARLTEFVLSHGFLELTVIVAGAFASFLIGRSFYVRPFSKIREHLAMGAKEGFIVAGGVAPWLVLAAIFESFVSPNPMFEVETKLIAGIVIGCLFWLWTFLPPSRQSQA